MTSGNHPDLWRAQLPAKTKDSHKYQHGHALIYAAPELTGATCLAATACARMGTGLVTVLADADIVSVYRTVLPAHILVRGDLDWQDSRVTARLYGSGGLSVIPDFTAGIPVVLDADALSNLPRLLTKNYILTPHDGEFDRAFPDFKGSRLDRAKAAAAESGAHIVLKGAESIIVAPDGRYVINHHATPHLASAGTGDVLAGMITGFLARDMPVFEAACASVWIHGECGRRIGSGLVASDISDQIPAVMSGFL
jgi:NAD(P)H-hydrate repair Nnr-like enzyme with NAD(P)H-hydrate dehydratase domain